MTSRLLIACGLRLAAPVAFGLNKRSAVAVTGLDSNACTTDSPCRSFSVAIPATEPGGEVIAFDSAGYGTFTVDRSLTIGLQ